LGEPTTTPSTGPSIPSLVRVQGLLCCVSIRLTRMPRQKSQSTKDRIATAYRALNQLRVIPTLSERGTFFETEEGDRYVLVTEDVSGQALRCTWSAPRSLSHSTRSTDCRELLDALSHGIVRRRASQPHPRNRWSTRRAVALIGSISPELAPIEASRSHTRSSMKSSPPIAHRKPTRAGNASPASDVFSAGLIFYELFAGDKNVQWRPNSSLRPERYFPSNHR